MRMNIGQKEYVHERLLANLPLRGLRFVERRRFSKGGDVVEKGTTATRFVEKVSAFWVSVSSREKKVHFISLYNDEG